MFKSISHFALAVSITASAVNGVVANDDVQDEIIVTGLRPLALKDVTSSVSVITAEDLSVRNSPFIVDQLRAAPGLAVSRSGARGGLTQLRARGAEANHTLVLIDGIEISDPVTGETDFGLWAGLVPSRIEVLRGEQSSLYGSDAIGAVINIVSDKSSGASFRAEGGSNATARAEGRIGVATGSGNIAISGAAYETSGVDTSGLDGEKDGSQSFSLNLVGDKEFGAGWTLNGLALFNTAEVETDSDTDFDGRLNDSQRDTDSRQWLIGANLQGEAFRLDHALRASYSQINRENFSDNSFTDETIGQRTKVSYSPSYRFAAGGLSGAVTGLFELEDEKYERISTDTFFGDPNQRQTFQVFSIAGETQFSIARASLNASIRHDDNDEQFNNATTWRVGGAYRFIDSVKLRASVGEGVKNPTFTELFGFFPGSFIGDPNLRPEKSFSYEFGFDLNTETASFSVTYFNAELEDEIFTVFNPDFTSSPANRSAPSERDGVELGASWTPTPALTVAGAFTHTSSTNELGIDEIRTPRNTGTFSLAWRSQSRDGLFAGLAVDYVGEQDDFFFTFPAERVTLPNYFLLSTNIEVPVADRFSITLRGENLLDERTTDVFGFEQTGAAVFGGFTIR